MPHASRINVSLTYQLYYFNIWSLIMISNKHVKKVYKMGEVDLTVIKDLNLEIDLATLIHTQNI